MNSAYKLEAYDKDNDVYFTLAESDDIDALKKIGQNIQSTMILTRKDNDEPIDWLVISDQNDKQLCCLTEEGWE